MELFEHLLDEGSHRVLDFPEFLREGRTGAYVSEFADFATRSFDRLTARLPGFAAHMNMHPFSVGVNDHGKTRSKARRRARKRWQANNIVAYLQQAGMPALHDMHAALGRALPAWTGTSAALTA
jgi:hypothetical protein